VPVLLEWTGSTSKNVTRSIRMLSAASILIWVLKTSLMYHHTYQFRLIAWFTNLENRKKPPMKVRVYFKSGENIYSARPLRTTLSQGINTAYLCVHISVRPYYTSAKASTISQPAHRPPSLQQYRTLQMMFEPAGAP